MKDKIYYRLMILSGPIASKVKKFKGEREGYVNNEGDFSAETGEIALK